MKRLLSLLLCICCIHNLHAQPFIQKALPSVVNLSVIGHIKEGKTPKHLGSGVIIDAKKGYIVTNAHVAHQPSIIVANLSDGRHFMAKFIGKDPMTDIAVLQIKANHLQALSVNKNIATTIGEQVIAIGNPFGLQQTVTSGIVSAKHRQIGLETIEDFIQTDAPINPGNSGGALINIQGQLIGINTAILSPKGGNIGIGFAIPMYIVKTITDQLIHYGHIERGMVGIVAQNMTPALADALAYKKNAGVLIDEVLPKSPAKLAGLKQEDIIIKINNQDIENAGQMKSIISSIRAGTKTPFLISRKGHIMTLNVAPTSKHLDETNNAISPSIAGMSFKQFIGINDEGQEINGIQVIGLRSGSPGWLAGIMPGDIILNINKHNIQNIDQLKSLPKHGNILIKALRNHREIYLVIQA